ncbi:MAG TPA: hypothetical protein VEU47_01115 [Candidatus Cybelea sp.]|nr:hypothetical protein [Candidatus Cybelea sp.]
MPVPDIYRLYKKIFDSFEAPVSRFDCGRMCAPHNDGEPVCCSTRYAVPVVEKEEYRLLRSRTDMWRRYKPDDAVGRQIVDELPTTCLAVECRGARHCERDNRSLACRAFPFFPYLTREGEFIGLGYYWTFEDLCWVISNLQVVDKAFVDEFVGAYELLMREDKSEYDNFLSHSAYMRRVFSRWSRFIPLIDRNGGFLKVLPHGGRVVPCAPEALPRHAPYRGKKTRPEALDAAE